MMVQHRQHQHWTKFHIFSKFDLIILWNHSHRFMWCHRLPRTRKGSTHPLCLSWPIPQGGQHQQYSSVVIHRTELWLVFDKAHPSYTGPSELMNEQSLCSRPQTWGLLDLCHQFRVLVAFSSWPHEHWRRWNLRPWLQLCLHPHLRVGTLKGVDRPLLSSHKPHFRVQFEQD